MRILIADDEVDFIDMLKERLRYKNVDMDHAYDGRQALELIKSNHYDIIFLDHNMPEMTGLELVRYIRENSINSKTVMITGYPAIRGFFAKAIGTDEYLTKPVKLKDVEDILEKYRC
ncbi:MAG: response regulator [Candidatus Omnitrophota bacterium]|nr:response regulator [Candidatus Omnitrophota bacterium]